jgi:hypothetical protein
MLDYDQRKNLDGGWGDNVTPQQKADFNKKMRRKLKLWLKEAPDMVRILNGLPNRVIENANLSDDLPNVIEFIDKFLEKADALPVAEHESGEMRTFRNDATCHDDIDEWGPGWKPHIKIINDKKYLIRVSATTANPAEIRICDILQKHSESMQRYIDPTIAVIDVSGSRRKLEANKVMADMFKRRDMMGACSMDNRIIEGEIPTKPPCKPRIMIDGKICDFEIEE